MRFASLLRITINNISYWFSLSMSKGFNRGFPMPEIIIGNTEGYAKANNT
jgi:hypothetical protein